LNRLQYPLRCAGIGAIAIACIASLASAAEAPAAPVVLPGAPQILEFLDQSIEWYRQRATEPQLASEATGQMLAIENTQNAQQIIRLSFEFARNAATLLPRSDRAPDAADGAGEYPALLQLQTRIEKDLQQTQNELEADRAQLAAARGKRRADLAAQILELPGELELLGARRDAVRSMLEFLNGTSANGQGGTGLRAQIEALAATVNLSGAASAASAGAAAPAAAAPVAPEPSSLWDRAALSYLLARKSQRLDALMARAGELARRSHELTVPYVERLKALSATGDRLAAEADRATTAQLALERTQLDALALQFKQYSAVVTPLSKQGVLLQLYRNNLASWQADLKGDYRSAMEALGVRAGALALFLALVLAAGAFWKRAVDRYVGDAQRRHQFLFLRRVVLWSVVALSIAYAFAGQLGSFATFAGLLTAGVAVALQNVILSAAGYFFLIGKYGIRVGDRVQIGGVSGEVLDIGLVRLHLLELDGGSSGPTGRVVTFSNSIIFQPTGGLYKQLSGIHLAWHEMTLLLASGSDHGAVRARLLQAATTTLAHFRGELELQARSLAKSARSSAPQDLQPNVRLRLLAAGVEATVYYPVDAPHATEIDESMARALLAELEREPRLRLAGAEGAALKLRTSGL
jgi:hypothetical protein